MKPRTSRRRNPDVPFRFPSGAEAEQAALAARPAVLADPEFQSWFGRSQVVDAEGKPLIVYHGTNSSEAFTEFSDEDAPDRGGLIAFFSSSPAFAEGYGKNVYPVYLRCYDVFDFRDAGSAESAVNYFYDDHGGIRDDYEARRILMGLSRTHPEFDIKDIEDERFSYEDLTKELFLEAVLEGSWDALEANEFVEYLREGWDCDGIVLLEGGAINYGIFDAEDVKSATGNNGDYDGGDPDILANPRRHNPMRFDLQYAPEAVKQSQGSRAARSVMSAALRKKSVERMAASPHNFVVVLRDNTEDDTEDDPEWDYEERTPSFSDAVTLVLNISAVREIEKDAKNRDRDMRESLYTAFTYLHRLGDKFVDGFVEGESGYSLLEPDARPDGDPIYASFYQMVDEHLAWLEQEGGVSDRESAVTKYLHMIGLSVNSKMVRENYSGGWDQAFADLFPLCELTPPTRPLLLPVNPKAKYVSSRPVTVFNTRIVPDFNVRFRAFYNKYIPTLYGSVEWV